MLTRAQRVERRRVLGGLDSRLAKLTRALLRAKDNEAAQPKKKTTRKLSLPGPTARKTSGRLVTRRQFRASLRKKGVPRSIAKNLVLVRVRYRGFDGKPHEGQIVVHKELKASLVRVFRRIFKETKFPIASVIPVGDSRINWSDALSVKANNSSGFNWRLVSGSYEVSDHAFGTAIDINPRLNPWVKKGTANKGYNPRKAGTLHANSAVVKIFKQEGWKWGGDWKKSKDWQHFYNAGIPLRDFGKVEVAE